jgi:beta-mannosidase
MKNKLITQSLSSETWNVKQVGTTNTYPASVPGDVYSDLLAADKIPDPFYRDNENDLQWIGESDWVYESTFTVSDDLLKKDRVLLRCEGLDTLATLSLNGKRIAKTDNMYRTWEFDLKRQLVAGENHLSITFASAEKFVARKQKQIDLRAGHVHDSRGHIRKQPSNFGWDWGIKAVTCGIWRDISLVAFSTARISDVRIVQNHQKKGQVGLTVETGVERTGRSKLTTRVTVQIGTETVSPSNSRRCRIPAAEKPGQGFPASSWVSECSFNTKRTTMDLQVNDPQLWWPNNMGEQPLYEVTVELLNKEGVVLDSCIKRIGLRTLEVDIHPDEWGESFQFVVNGVPFFAKGANWVPADAILSRLTPEHVRGLVQSAVEANFNMLRVWGGGIYEDEAFYNACDELGICVWQDFMFAGTAYPTPDQAFMKTVKPEIEDAVRQLRHHPCIALWCGNNEIESNKYYYQVEDLDGWKDYKPLFYKLIPDVLSELDPERLYWPSSPHKSSTDPDKTADPSNGNVHFWRVWHGKAPFEFYRERTPRFITEYGFQSFPEPKTVYGFTEKEDRNITSRVMEHHQRSGTGNTLIMQYMLDWFRLPVGFDNVLWASQILQGIAMKTASEFWRQSMPCSMGALYWQFNDNWPVASWSSIDYHGRWKATQYMAKHFFAPLMVSGREDVEQGTVEVHVTSDLMKAVAGKVEWTVTDTHGNKLLEEEKEFRAKAGTSRKVKTLRLKSLLKKHGPNNVLVWLKLTAPDQPASTNLILFSRPKHLELSSDPGIRTTVRKRKDGSFRVQLSSRKPALWTWLEVEGVDARLSDNFFHLRPGQPISVELFPQKEMSLSELKISLSVRSLCDTYGPVQPDS